MHKEIESDISKEDSLYVNGPSCPHSPSCPLHALLPLPFLKRSVLSKSWKTGSVLRGPGSHPSAGCQLKYQALNPQREP